ncbi:MAG: hypothetical protein DRI87_10025, partial [Bacteroidetes bacterium]
VFSTLSLTIQAQTNFSNDLVYYGNYYDSLINVLGIDSMHGTGYIQYQRWFDYWTPKLMPDLDYADYQNNLLNYARNYTPAGTNTQNKTNWHLIGPNDIPPPTSTNAEGVGQIHYIYIDQRNHMYACSPVGGLFRSTDEGRTWQNAGTDKGLARSGVSSVVVDSHDPKIWYITTGNGESYLNSLIWQQAIGLYRTTDEGATWELLGLDAENDSFIQSMRKVIEVTGNEENTHLIVTTTNGLYEVTDANTNNWTITRLIDGEFYDVIQDLQTPNIIYASGSQGTGVFQYDLNSETKTTLIAMDTLPAPGKRRFSLKIIPDEPGYLYAVFSARDICNHLYRYKINIKTWVDKGEIYGASGYERTLGWSIRPQKNNEGRVCIYGRDANPMFLFYDDLGNDTVDHIVIVKNQIDKPHVDFHYLLIEENNDVIWAGTDGGVFRGEFVNDSTIEWKARSNGLAVNTIEHIGAYYNVNTGSTQLTSGQFDCGSNTYLSDNDIDWDIRTKLGGDGMMNDIVNMDKYYLSVNEPEPIIKLYDNNSATTLNNSNVPDCTNPGTILWPVLIWHVRFARNGTAIYGVGTQGVSKYTDGAWQQWSEFTDADLYPEMGCGHSGVYNITMYGNIKYVSTFGSSSYFYQRVYKQSSNNMSDWVLLANQPDTHKWINDIETDQHYNVVYVGMRKDISTNAVYKVNAANPADSDWQGIDYNLPDHIVINCFERESNRLWIGTDRGVFYLNDGEDHWIDYTQNLPNVEVKDIKIVNNRVYAGTYGRGLWQASAPGCYSGEEVTLSGTIVGPGEEQSYYGDIRIQSGTTAIVYGTLKMGAGTRIIVERTAKLIVDGGTVTNACPDMWQGIEVWGNSNAVQDTLHQGYVILKNGATLQYAERAVA